MLLYRDADAWMVLPLAATTNVLNALSNTTFTMGIAFGVPSTQNETFMAIVNASPDISLTLWDYVSLNVLRSKYTSMPVVDANARLAWSGTFKRTDASFVPLVVSNQMETVFVAHPIRC